MSDFEFDLALCRAAIDQTHDCEVGRLLDVVELSLTSGEHSWQGKVYTLHLERHPFASRCYAWQQRTGPSSMVVHAVLQSDKVTSAEIAVRSRLGKRDDRKRVNSRRR